MALPQRLPTEVQTVLSVGAGVVTHEGLARVGASRADINAWCRHGLIERVTRGVYVEPLVDATREESFRRFVHGVLLDKDGG